MVASPAPSSGQSSRSIMNAPAFFTNMTSKSKYRNTLRRWHSIIRKLAKTDVKAQGLLESIGDMIYLSCDDISQNLLEKAELDGKLILSGSDTDPDRSKLIEDIISVIAKDSATEKVRQELALLTAIHGCTRNEEEQPSDFVNRFKGAVAMYVNHTGRMDDATNRQFCIMLIRNAQLPADTGNSVTLQLVMLSQSKNQKSNNVSIEMQSNDLKNLINIFTRTESSASQSATVLDPATKERISSLFSNALQKNQNEIGMNTVMFTLDDAFDAVSQVKLENTDSTSVPVPIRSSMLGKRNLDQMLSEEDRLKELKSRTKCRACRKIGHWYDDREECRKIMAERHRTADLKKKQYKSTKEVDSVNHEESARKSSLFQ